MNVRLGENCLAAPLPPHELLSTAIVATSEHALNSSGQQQQREQEQQLEQEQEQEQLE